MLSGLDSVPFSMVGDSLKPAVRLVARAGVPIRLSLAQNLCPWWLESN